MGEQTPLRHTPRGPGELRSSPGVWAEGEVRQGMVGKDGVSLLRMEVKKFPVCCSVHQVAVIQMYSNNDQLPARSLLTVTSHTIQEKRFTLCPTAPPFGSGSMETARAVFT